MLPSHYAKHTYSVHTNVIPKWAQLRVGIWRSRGECVHPGSKAPSFARWADNRPSYLKRMGNLAHFSCKCLAGKRYKTWEVNIGEQWDLGNLWNCYVQVNNREDKNVTPVLDWHTQISSFCLHPFCSWQNQDSFLRMRKRIFSSLLKDNNNFLFSFLFISIHKVCHSWLN